MSLSKNPVVSRFRANNSPKIIGLAYDNNGAPLWNLQLFIPLVHRLENWRTGCGYKNYAVNSWMYVEDEGKGDKVIGFSSDPQGWRMAGFADHIIRLNHTGWYCDAFNDCTLRACVAQLPARKGESVFLPGYYEKTSGTYVFWLSSSSDKEEAARNADNWTQSTAERSRESDIEYQAKDQIELIQADIVELETKKAEALKTHKRLKRKRDKSAAAIVADHITCIDSEIQDAQRRIEKILENPYSAVA